VTDSTFLVVGLGNAGPAFRKNRHNIGFMFVDQLASAHAIRLSRIQHKAIVGDGRVNGTKLILAKPQTWMNRSGQSVAPLMRYHRLPLENLLVVYDDLDLPLGMLRLRPIGGTGGHKGMESIVQQVGSQEFPRLRIGIGRPPGRMDPAEYVLQDFRPMEQELADIAIRQGHQCLLRMLTDGIELAMNDCNRGDET
jgi:PTH1 family peptidyl-tRNA hydrolase